MHHPYDAVMDCQERLWPTRQLQEIARASAFKWKKHAGRKHQRDGDAWFDQQVPLDGYPRLSPNYEALPQTTAMLLTLLDQYAEALNELEQKIEEWTNDQNAKRANAEAA